MSDDRDGGKSAKTGDLTIKVKDGELIEESHSDGSRLPTVRFYLGISKEWTHTSPANVEKGEMKPSWNSEAINFTIRNEGSIKLEVWDEDTLDFIGKADIDLTKIQAG